jgi:hypothetical protein
LKKALLFTLIFTFIILSLKAQYFTALGGRINNLAGISFKQFSHRYRGNGIEVIVASYQIVDPSQLGYVLVLMYEHQKRLPYFRTLGFPFDFFYGGGLHCGYYNDILLLGSGDSQAPKYLFSSGPTGIIGIERRFRKVPLTLGIDFRPYYEITSKRLMKEFGAITVRYVFD